MRVDIGDGVRLYFDVVGSGLQPTDEAMLDKPTLLLLHGGPGFDHSLFRPWFDRFADTHQVIYLDQRGHGRSDGRDDESGWNLDTWADDVVRFCDALGIDHPVVLGLSFGGFVAMHYAARHPDHASAIILASTAARRDRELSERRFEERGGPEAAASYRRIWVDGDLSPEAFADYRTINMPLYSNVPSPFGPDRPLMNRLVYVHFEAEGGPMDLRADLQLIVAPTLVTAGTDDPMTPPELSVEMADLLSPGVGRLEIVPEAGHGTFRDQPEATEVVLRRFLAEVGPSAAPV